MHYMGESSTGVQAQISLDPFQSSVGKLMVAESLRTSGFILMNVAIAAVRVKGKRTVGGDM